MPIIPTSDPTITIRWHGKLVTGRSFTLQRITETTPLDKIYPVVDHNGHVYLPADGATKTKYTNGFPISAAYDDDDMTGQFQPTRAMSKIMWQATDQAVFEMLLMGVDQAVVDKADLVSWPFLKHGIDTTLCDYCCYEFFEHMVRTHYEPDDNWANTLRQFIMDTPLVMQAILVFNRCG